MNNRNNDALSLVGVFLVGLISGVLVSSFMPIDKDKMRMMMERRRRKFRNMWRENRNSIRERLHQFSNEERRLYQDIKNAVIDKIMDLDMHIEDIDKKQYFKIVQDTIRDIQERSFFPDEMIEKMQDYWERNYEKIKDELEK